MKGGERGEDFEKKSLWDIWKRKLSDPERSDRAKKLMTLSEVSWIIVPDLFGGRIHSKCNA